jgi:hypothetical protein
LTISIFLLGGSLAVAQAQEASRPKATIVSFELLPSNHMVIEGSINGAKPRRFIFDLGAPVTLLGTKAAESAQVIDKNAPRILLFGARGDSTVKTFQVGDTVVKNLPVLVMDHPAVSALGTLTGKPLDGLVGYTFFARYKTTIDYQAKTMALEPVDFEVRDLFKTLPDQLAGPKTQRTQVLAPAGLWGLSVGEPEPDAPGVPITSVRPGTPAASGGLRIGDILTTLDGRWTTTVADVYAAVAKIEPGRTVDVVVLRDGQELTVRVAPRVGL